jgi:hypothetical protein
MERIEMAKHVLSLGYHEALALICHWHSKEVQLTEVRRMFEKKEVTNLVRIRLNQWIINRRATGSQGDEHD